MYDIQIKGVAMLVPLAQNFMGPGLDSGAPQIAKGYI